MRRILESSQIQSNRWGEGDDEPVSVGDQSYIKLKPMYTNNISDS